MADCEHLQGQMLDYLYGLLEDDIRQALLSHLEGCNACQAALARAQVQQKLLATAAKAEFPEVRFQRPDSSTSAQELEEPVLRPLSPRPAWLRWAVAASVLFLISLTVPGGWWTWRLLLNRVDSEMTTALLAESQAHVQQLHALHRAKLTQAESEIKEVQEQIRKLNEQQQEKWTALQQKARDEQLRVLITGPEVVQPGARNVYEIQTRGLTGRLVPTSLSARVVSIATNDRQVVYEEKNISSPGAHRLVLPPDLPLKPDTTLALEVVADRGGSAKQEVRHQLALAAPVYLTHLYTDKPMYRPGETVHFRSLTLERFSLKPADEDFHLLYTVTSPNGEQIFNLEGSPLLLDEKGQSPLVGPDKKPVHGIGAGEFPIPPELAGGEYTLTVREANKRFPEQQRKFIINKYENPRLDKKLEFTRKSYGPGDELLAACTVSRVEGGAAVANRPVTATMQIDGKSYGPDGKEGNNPLRLHTDERGNVNVRFKLPAVIERGQATLSVQFDDGGSVETLVRPIPIALKKLDIEFFPEGGDLLAGLPNRVYFQARTTLGKPAEVTGRIVDQNNQAVAEDVHTLSVDDKPELNQGMGAFRFTPRSGHKYELKIDSPSGIEGKYPLPELKNDGVVLNIPKGMSSANEPIQVVVQSSQKDRSLLVGAYCRGRLMDHQTITSKTGEATEVELKPEQGAGGVYRVTVFEQQPGDGGRLNLVPKAERLVYRAPAEQLVLTAKPEHKQYVPGEKVNLTLDALTEKEEPAPAILLVSVVDKSVITMADEKTARTMPTHYFLTTEVRRPEDLEYADFLLGAHPKAAEALDLLLGTQGWRRFAEQDPGDFHKKHKEDADRLLVLSGQTPQKGIDLAKNEVQESEVRYAQQFAKLQEQHEKAHAALLAAQNDDTFKDQLATAGQTVAQATREHVAAQERLDRHMELLAQARSAILVVLGIGLVSATIVLVVLGIRRGLHGAIPFFATAAVCGSLLIGFVMFASWAPEKAATHLALARRSSVNAEGPAPPAEIDATDEFGIAGGRAPGAPVPPGPGGMQNEAKVAADKAGGAPELPQMLQLREEKRGLNRDFMPRAAFGEQAQLQKEASKIRPRAMEEGRKATILDLKAGEKLREQDKEAMLRGKDGKADRPAMGRSAARPDPVAGGALRLNGRFGGFQGGQGFGGGGFSGFQGGQGFGGRLMPGQWAAGSARRAGGWNASAPAAPPFVVRQYAHLRPPGTPSEERRDFVDTVCWYPALVLPNGQGEVSFDLCDSVTSYQVTAFGHTLDGRIGAVTTTLEARLPFTLEPKLPIEVTASDKIDVPVSIANNTTDRRPVHLRLQANGLHLEGNNDSQLIVEPEGRARRLFRLQPSIVEGEVGVNIEGKSEPFSDSVTRSFRVVPDGFPIVGSHSDVLEKVANDEIVLPETWVKGTLKCQVNVYPSTLAALQKGLEALLREPHGCFEQTSTSNYPNLLILDYLKESDQVKPELEQRARDLLAKGYQKLVSFECLDPSQKKQGYEWFGGSAPPHEALTAYGLLQFRDMARVYDVDKTMLERTKNYLISRKDSKGGFQRNPRALDTFGRAPDDITNAYIIWALTESGKEDDVEKELAALSTQAKSSKDPYFLSLVATSLINRGKTDDGVALLKTVAAAQKDDGHLDAAKTSITGSGGRDLQIETTALAVLGWLKANRPADFNPNIQKAIKWIGQQRGGYGGFGSTQSTILALKALITFTKANKKTAEGGELSLFVGDRQAAQVKFAAGAQDALVLAVPNPEENLKPGKNSLRVEITGKNSFPYTLTWSYQTLKPTSAEKCPVQLNTRLDRQNANEGETVHLTVTVENAEDKGQGMAIAIVGLPAGLTLPEDMKQLKDHARLREDGKEKGLISAWETRGREVILYWRDLAPKQKIEVPLDLICRVPGEYHGPASRAYLYYNADLKHWVDPLSVSIRAKSD